MPDNLGTEEVDMRRTAITKWVLFATASMVVGLNWTILVGSPQAKDQAKEENAILELNAAVEAAWNRHDAATMDKDFVEDCDFVNVFGEWIRGRDNLVKIHSALFTGPLRENYKRINIEKLRFVRPDVAVVHVRGRNTDREGKLIEGNKSSIGVLVMVKEQGKWWIVAGQNTEVRPLPESFKASGR